MFKVEELTAIVMLLQRIDLKGSEAPGFVQLLNKIVEERNRLVQTKEETD